MATTAQNNTMLQLVSQGWTYHGDDQAGNPIMTKPGQQNVVINPDGTTTPTSP